MKESSKLIFNTNVWKICFVTLLFKKLTFIKLLTLFFQNGIQKKYSEPLDVLLHHQRVSMATQCLVMNTHPHNSAQIYVFDLDVISFSNLHFLFLSEEHLLHLCRSHTHSESSLSHSLTLSLSVSPDWEKLSSSQNPLCLCVLMRTNAQADTHGHIHVHQNIALNTHVTYACRQRQSWGRLHTARLQDNETDIQDGLKALRSELTRSNGLMLKDRFSDRLMCLKHLAWAQ